MAQVSSGKVLREARERKNYDLTTVARRLRIRPDILRAIEAGDFSSMPPRGYTRNMVNAYARLLGLNPTEIVNMYLDEVYAHQIAKARGSAAQSGFIMEGERRRPRIGRSESRTSEKHIQSDNYGNDEPSGSTRSMKRHLFDDRTPYSRDDYGVTRARVERPGRSDRDFLSHHSGYGDTSFSSTSSGYSSRGRGRDIHVGQTPMQYSAPRFPAIFRSRAVIVIAAVLVVVALVMVFFMVRGHDDTPAKDDVSQLPVSGISDTTGTSDDDAATASVEIAPTSARVIMTVAEGKQCYIETYTDGDDVKSDILTGPTDKTVEVTGTWTITTYAPDNITVTVNGEKVSLTTDEKYPEMYAYTVDFPKILEEWKTTHTSRGSQRQAAVAEATQAATQQTQVSSSAAAATADTNDEDEDENELDEDE